MGNESRRRNASAKGSAVQWHEYYDSLGALIVRSGIMFGGFR